MIQVSAKKRMSPKENLSNTLAIISERCGSDFCSFVLFVFHSSAAKPNFDKRSRRFDLTLLIIVQGQRARTKLLPKSREHFWGLYTLLGLSEWYILEICCCFCKVLGAQSTLKIESYAFTGPGAVSNAYLCGFLVRCFPPSFNMALH